MKNYPVEHWKALGEWVSVARHQAGYSDTKRWAAEVGRSTRMLQGLERGEAVGAKTIEAIAEALGVANWSLFAILDRGAEVEVEWSPTNVNEARARYEAETGLEADDGDSNLLTYITDAELLAELGRRLATRPMSRTERRMTERFSTWDEVGGLDTADQRAMDDLERERHQEAVRRQREAPAVGGDAAVDENHGAAG